MGPEARLSSLQAALLCGIGLQYKTVDFLTSELALPSNQVLAMFNKGIRKISLALNGIVEESERAAMLGGDAMRKAEKKAAKMKNVTQKTLEEDAEEGAQAAMATLKGQSLPSSIAQDDDIMQYAVRGTDEEWSKALEGKDVDGGTVQIMSMQEKRPGKRRVNDEDIQREMDGASTPKSSSKKQKKNKSSSKKKKQRAE